MPDADRIADAMQKQYDDSEKKRKQLQDAATKKTDYGQESELPKPVSSYVPITGKRG